MALITFISDIGNQDFVPGAVKAQLLHYNPGSTVIDISHNISPFNMPQAAYVARNATRHFPAYSFHVVMVNMFESRPEHLLLAYYKEQYYLCADNGLLSMILEDKPELVVGLPLDKASPKNAIFCAKIMGQVIAQVANGLSIQEIGIPDFVYIERNALKPLLGNNWIEGQIIFIDNFENVVVNITREEFEEQRKGRKFQIHFVRNETIDQISDTYGDVPEGEKLALFNSAGYLEIAINKGNASGLFGLKGYDDRTKKADVFWQKQIMYQTVKVFFD